MNCSRCDSPIPEGSKFCLTCGADLSNPGSDTQSLAPADELTTRLTQSLEGKYKIGDLLGRGGMGAVFLAEDLTLERPVAIKVLPPDVSHDQNLVARFEREARTAAKLDHPNIIPIFSVESVGGLHFFVMKFVDGQSLERIIEHESVSIEHTQEYLWEAARALGHAHQRGIVHRDIKPGNIMIDHDGRAMLADFGISKATHSATQYTGTGQVIGTPFYMSPEQAKGGEVDGRSDQYSLAVVGFQMLTGRLPFTDDAIHAIIYKHIFEPPPRIDELRPDVPAYLVAALHKGLAKEPADRFETMDEFAQAVNPHRRISAGGTGPRTQPASPDAPTTITPVTAPLKVTTAPPKKKKSRAAVFMSVLLIALGGSGYFAWSQGMLAQFGLGGGSEAAPAVDPGSTPLAAVADDSVTTPTVPEDTLAPGVPDSQPAAPTPTAAQTEPPVTQPRSTPTRTQPPASPPARPERRLGRISVDITNGFGEVYVDDVYVKGTPLIGHELEAGTHIVRIVGRTCERTDTLRVEAGRTRTHRVPFRCEL